MSILCIFFIWPLPYWHRCINSTVNSNHGVTVLQGAASCPCCCRRKAGAVEGGGDLTDVMQHPDVQGCTALFLWLNTQKKPFGMRKGRPIPNVPENPSLVTVSHSASGLCFQLPERHSLIWYQQEALSSLTLKFLSQISPSLWNVLSYVRDVFVKYTTQSDF